MTSQARKVAPAKAAPSTTAEEKVDADAAPSVSGVMNRSDPKKHSIIYRDADGKFMGSVYLPRDLLEQIGNPDAVEITIRPFQG